MSHGPFISCHAHEFFHNNNNNYYYYYYYYFFWEVGPHLVCFASHVAKGREGSQSTINIIKTCKWMMPAQPSRRFWKTMGKMITIGPWGPPTAAQNGIRIGVGQTVTTDAGLTRGVAVGAKCLVATGKGPQWKLPFQAKRQLRVLLWLALLLVCLFVEDALRWS